MDPELLPGSGTRKIQSWIRNKSFRIHNTGFKWQYKAVAEAIAEIMDKTGAGPENKYFQLRNTGLYGSRRKKNLNRFWPLTNVRFSATAWRIRICKNSIFIRIWLREYN